MRSFQLLFLLAFSASCVDHEISGNVNCDPAALVLRIASVTPASACDQADGVVSLKVRGGAKPYRFSSDGITWVSDSIFTNLLSTRYNFRMQDARGCTAMTDTLVVSAPAANDVITVTSDNDCLTHNGSIMIDAPDDVFFSLDNGPYTSLHQFDHVSAGEHFLYSRTNEGCTSVRIVDVPHGFTGVSWANDILPIMERSCANKGCHDGITRLDWRDYNEVKPYAEEIKRKTRDKSMPFDKALPQDEIEKITCWVDDGALNN